MRTTAARYIDATEETTAKLAKTFQCTPKFVYLALTYRSDTEKPEKSASLRLKTMEQPPCVIIRSAKRSTIRQRITVR